MKFAVAVFLLALAVGANCSVFPFGPVVVGGPFPGAVVVGGPFPAPVQVVSGPVAVPPVVVAAPSAVSVSKTRGAVHVAPLPGHSQSVVQANLQPAPGTW
ncbi:adult cuticle protein 1-like [Haematobia irritans]|uniref:adult cuticle protein 1-like n=1 Tax=Haematobia irritans TaxID=7368 RepID=UPI003F4F8FFC